MNHKILENKNKYQGAAVAHENEKGSISAYMARIMLNLTTLIFTF